MSSAGSEPMAGVKAKLGEGLVGGGTPGPVGEDPDVAGSAAESGAETVTGTVLGASSLQHIDLDVSGMTCASCSARVQKKLSKTPGVIASVNYATGLARIAAPAEVTAADLIGIVEKTGYGAQVRPPAEAGLAASLAAQQRVEEAEEKAYRALKQRLVGAAVFAFPVIAISMVPAWQFSYWQWVAFALTVPVATWGAWPFHRAALVNARHGASTMDTLVSLGVTAAFSWSTWALIWGNAGHPELKHSFSWFSSTHDSLYLETAAGVTVFLLLGRFLEARAARRSQSALSGLVRMHPQEARLWHDGKEVSVPVDALSPGQEIVVRPGERLPTDGVISAGNAAVDMAVITGEPAPVDLGPGHAVLAGSIPVDGRLIVQVTHAGADSTLARITQLVQAAQTGKAPVQRLADKVSAVFVPVVIVFALITGIFWAIWTATQGQIDLPRALTAAVAVLVVACPCALGLATPTALLVGTGQGARRGILLTGPQVLETARNIAVVAFDKTGTLTDGVMRVHGVEEFAPPEADSSQRVDVLLADGSPLSKETWQRAAALTTASDHPIAKAVSQYLMDHPPTESANARLLTEGDSVSSQSFGGDGDATQLGDVGPSADASGMIRAESPSKPEVDALVPAQDFRAIAGKGMCAEVAGTTVYGGSQAYLESSGLEIATISRGRNEISEEHESGSGEELLETRQAAGAARTVGRNNEEEPLETRQAAEQSRPGSEFWLGWEGQIRVKFTCSDTVRLTAAAAIRRLHAAGLRTALLTGDTASAAAPVAAATGIASGSVHARLLPAEKVAAIAQLQQTHGPVAMVGDGVNDAGCLAQADLGIAMGQGTDIAIDAADLILMRDNPEAVVDAIELSRATLTTIKGNLFWAFGYNIAALPLAATGLLNPMVAGAAMAFSSVFVVTNSLRLRRRFPAKKAA